MRLNDDILQNGFKIDDKKKDIDYNWYGLSDFSNLFVGLHDFLYPSLKNIEAYEIGIGGYVVLCCVALCHDGKFVVKVEQRD